MADITPTFNDLDTEVYTNVNVGTWYFEQNIGLVPDTVAPYLAAHGFIVNGGTENYIDGEFAGYLLNMERNKFDRLSSMQILLNTQVSAFNEGRANNNTRYNDLLTNLQSLLANNQADIASFLDTEVTDAAGYVTLLLSDLDTFESTVASDFTTHQTTATAFLTNLGLTEEARINETFDDQLTVRAQGLADRGFYSSALSAQVALQVERERTQALIELNDRLNREKFENQHRLYDQQFRMRISSLEQNLRIRQGAGEFHANLIKYQLDQRSNLALALFGMVERREDDYPGVGDLVATVASMGDDQ